MSLIPSILIAALTVGTIYFGANEYSEYRCSQYGKLMNKETFYESFVGCFVKEDDGTAYPLNLHRYYDKH